MNLEAERLALEREKMELDSLHKQKELEFKHAELAAKIEDDQRKSVIKFSPGVTATIIAALLTFSGTLVAHIFQAVSEKRKINTDIALEQERVKAGIVLEREKFESSLILKALEGKTREESVENLQFLLGAGLLESRRKQLSALTKEPSKVPTIKPIEIRRVEIQLKALECSTAGKVFDINSLTCTEAPLRIDSK
jgi:hypothetical protein